jgi:ABC-type nitrate/sulfonate/bicarbonate transport system permease component
MKRTIPARMTAEISGFIRISFGSILTREFFTVSVPVLLLWEILPDNGAVSHYLLPPPSEIIVAFKDMLIHKHLVMHFVSSLFTFTAGLFLACLVAIPSGIAIGWNAVIRKHALPFFQILSPVPPPAWIPITVVIFGIGLPMKVFLIFVGAVYPILFNTYQSVKDTDPRYLTSARSFGASEMTIIRHVYIRNCLGSIIMSVRTGVIMGLVMLTVAEMYGGRSGIGFLLVQAKEFFQIREMIVCMMILGATGWLFSEVLKYIEMKLSRWKGDSRD